MFGPDNHNAIKIIDSLKYICDSGDSFALNQTIKEMSQIRDGLQTLKKGKEVQLPLIPSTR
jgi:hypothetical protein